VKDKNEQQSVEEEALYEHCITLDMVAFNKKKMMCFLGTYHLEHQALKHFG